MSAESVDIRDLLIERIRELRALREGARSQSAIFNIDDMIALNKRIYYYIFKREL